MCENNAPQVIPYKKLLDFKPCKLYTEIGNMEFLHQATINAQQWKLHR